MTTASAGSRTEYFTDSHILFSTGYSTNKPRAFSQPTVKRQGIGPALLVYCPPTLPNEQFYCIPSTPDEDTPHSRTIGYPSCGLNQAGDEGLLDRLSRQAAEVAAAARFISQVDVVVPENPTFKSRTLRRPRLGSVGSVRDSILHNSLYVAKSRSASMQAHSSIKRSRMAVPPPLELQQSRCGMEDVQSPLPTRTSSRGAPSFDIARPLHSARSLPYSASSPALGTEPKSPLSVLTPENANTFQFDFSFPSEPPIPEPILSEVAPSEPSLIESSLSRSGSDATTDSQYPPTPCDSTSEEQLRQDIEAFVLEQGAYLRTSQRRVRRPPAQDTENERAVAERSLPQLPESDEPTQIPALDNEDVNFNALSDDPDVSPPTLRKKSIFGWLQRKSEVEVDDLLDLYLTDEQRKEEVKTVKRKPSRPRLTAFRHRVASGSEPTKDE